MKQNLPPRRSRGRSNLRGGRNPAHRNQPLESNGPEGRVRGTAQQILDRYLAMARDAQSSGDSVLAENLFQHAEHYQRLVAQFAPPQAQPSAQQPSGEATQGGEEPAGAARPEQDGAQTPADGQAGEGMRPRRRRRQRNQPADEPAAENGEPTESGAAAPEPAVTAA